MEASHDKEKQPALLAQQEFLDVSLHPLCWLLSCPLLHCGLCPYRTLLYFDATAVTREDVSVCGKNRVYVPYAEIQSIEQSRCCGCLQCVDVHGALGTFLPGMGCDAAASGRTRHALQTRVEAIHSLTQERDRRWETMEERTVELTEKMDRLLRHVAPAHVSMVERGDD
uniref:Uncharacterized protein n=1 Tax=Amphora coffeiformis TaxID=265554 RepID=A0A7S3P3R7_9STRA|mmetsp:Transcript_4001/g.7998  ORF Transcript_4001/g.7998 Transcript_4001/m.7998 type:complete len:169 (-) Transcript_4001:134-640(-)